MFRPPRGARVRLVEDVAELDRAPLLAGPNPIVVVGLAFLAGIVLARMLARRARADARD